MNTARCGNGENASLGPRNLKGRGVTLELALKTGTISDYWAKSKKFYTNVFGLADFENVSVPVGKRCAGEVMFVNNALPIKSIIDAFESSFGISCRNYVGDASDICRPNTEWYIAEIKPSNPTVGQEGVTLREQLLRILKCCFENGLCSFNKDITFVCTGSLFLRGDSPHLWSLVLGDNLKGLYVDRLDTIGNNNFRYFRVNVMQ